VGIVSRGGSILARWIRKNKRENPFYTRFGDILDIAGPQRGAEPRGRPAAGAGADAGDGAQWEEVIVLGELARRGLDSGVQVMIEGPGHVPLHLVQAQIQGIKRLTHNAPLYVLGPLTTACAPGYDHIGAAIGGALAGYYGADFPVLRHPGRASDPALRRRRAPGHHGFAHRGPGGRDRPGREASVARNLEMSKARKNLDWEAMTNLALDPDLVRERRKDFSHQKECAMCGKFCAVRMQDGL